MESTTASTASSRGAFGTFRPRRASAAAAEDPFASLRDPNDNPFTSSPTGSGTSSRRATFDDIKPRRESEPEPVPLSMRDRRLSREWDASKVPPSRFQKLEGSIFATPASRDGHVARNKIKILAEKVKEKTHKK